MRKIIHIDMDAFFASIAQRDQPHLKGLPIAVGGQPAKRGVVATASYEARSFGIHSAMPMATAVRLCPQLIIVKPEMATYREVSEDIRKILGCFTEKIEPLSIDEAYLDISENQQFQGSASLLAQHIIDTIYQKTQLTASAGVSYCKFLAKYASNRNKPNGVFTIPPHRAQATIDTMPIEKFYGIGPATQKKLNEQGIFYGEQLKMADLQMLKQHLGKSASFYYNLAHAIDHREIQTHRERKSIATETTFQTDLMTKAQILVALNQLTEKAWERLNNHHRQARCITIKIKFYDFKIQNKSHTQQTSIDSLTLAKTISLSLLEQANPQKNVRLLGVSFSHLTPKGRHSQKSLFGMI